MFGYIVDNPREYSELLQFFSLFLLVVIGSMIYMMSQKTQALKKEISELEMECPACPANPKCPDHPTIPSCPSCPTCPSLTCDSDGECPDCICPTDQKCPNCPPCSANSNCPTVDDIIGGIFPGRNPGVTSGGRFFDVKANESYELMPDYDFYKAEEAFPSDSILTIDHPLRSGNVDVPVSQVNNSRENSSITSNMNTSTSTSLSNEVELGNRMARGLPSQPGNGSNGPNSSNSIPSTTRSLSPQ